LKGASERENGKLKGIDDEKEVTGEGNTYERSSGVAGVDPLKLWAKVAPPPSCLVGFCMPPALIGPTPPKAQPEPLFTGIAVDISTTVGHTSQAFVPYPAFHLATCLLHLFQNVVTAADLLQNHLAFPLGAEEPFLARITIVS
jgi:hypothetical protein